MPYLLKCMEPFLLRKKESSMTTHKWFIFFICCLIVVVFAIFGPMDYADALSVEADMKLMRVQVASRGGRHVMVETRPERIFPLTHPLSCEGIWTRTSADFGPWKDYCEEELNANTRR